MQIRLAIAAVAGLLSICMGISNALAGSVTQPGETVGLAEGAHEASALNLGSADKTPFGEDNRPRNYAENQQDQKNYLGDRTGFSNQIDDLAANHRCQ